MLHLAQSISTSVTADALSLLLTRICNRKSETKPPNWGKKKETLIESCEFLRRLYFPATEFSLFLHRVEISP